jgi:glc operon protein GlcG
VKRIARVVSSLALAAGINAAPAQVVDKKGLTLEGARAVIAAAMAEAKRASAPGGVIAVVDDGGNLMALERMDNTFAAGAGISIGKARTAALFQRPTRFFEEVIGKGRTAMVALNDFTPLQGGVPIAFDGRVIGGVGVSGAASAAQDEQIAVAGAEAVRTVLTSATAMKPAVAYFAKDEVAAAFAKGAVLFDASDKYMVHASRREMPGQAEVHTKDADIVYVLEGTATFVTGGTAVDAKVTAPDEIRGTEIAGGETRQIGKGDVTIVPPGTPHWFKAVSSPFLYYVVKAR